MPTLLQKQVNEFIIPALGLGLGRQRISEHCAHHWLHKLGYGDTEVRKGIYVDGHKRPDVVEHRQKFLEMIKEMISKFNFKHECKSELRLACGIILTKKPSNQFHQN